MTTLHLKKKKKKNRQLIYLSSVKDLTEDLEDRVLQAFHGHVGEENKITPYELFIKVYNINPNSIDIYKRAFFWNIIQKALYHFRKRGTLYVINKGSYLFVLQTKQESSQFKGRLDATIRALERTKINADKWVREEKWKEFEK